MGKSWWRKFLAIAGGVAALNGCVGGNPADMHDETKLTPGTFAEAPPVYRPAKGGEVKVAEAAALALQDAGVMRLPSVPAVGAAAVTELFNHYSGLKAEQYSKAETALALALGDSMQGRRAAVVLGAEQLLPLAGTLLQTAMWGCDAGVVILVITDNNGRYSSFIYNAEQAAKFSTIPFFAAKSPEISKNLNDALATSEKYRIPFMVLLDIDELARPVSYEPWNLLVKERSYSKDVYRHVTSPALAVYRNRVLDAKRQGTDESAVQSPKLPVMPKDLPRRFVRDFNLYVPVMQILKEVSPAFVAVEGAGLSFFAYEPYNMVSAAGFSGAAVPLAARAALNGRTPAWAVMNGNDFMRHAVSIAEVMNNTPAPVKVLILNTNLPEVSGAEPLKKAELESALAMFGSQVVRLNAASPAAELKEQFYKTNRSAESQIIVIDYPNSNK